MASRIVRSLGLLSLLPVTFAACKRPAPGGSCMEGQAICENAKTVLVCQSGTFVEARCGGAGGCAREGERVTCDDSIAAVGDVCIVTGSEANRACSADKTQSLLCDKGTFAAVQTCPGGQGCQIKGETVTCDTSGAKKGDPCAPPSALSCAADAKSRLVCKDGKFALDRFCKGPKGCQQDAEVACDESIAEVGDPCSVSGFVACAPDGSRELICESGAYAPSLTCKKGICKILSATKIECR